METIVVKMEYMHNPKLENSLKWVGRLLTLWLFYRQLCVELRTLHYKFIYIPDGLDDIRKKIQQQRLNKSTASGK